MFFPTYSAKILAPIENVLEDLLVWLHKDAGLTWAWAIISLTVIVRLIIFPLTSKQTRSSLAMQRLQPYIKQLQQKHKDDRTALNQAMMEFYRDNKVNPLASCFPLVIQLPIFFALFMVLKNFEAPAGTSDNFTFLFGFVTDIRQHINNASEAFPKNWVGTGWLLLLFYIGSQMLSTVTMMTSPNPQQKYLFMLMPIFFSLFIVRFPIGVMLYWITTNLWSLGQYLVIVKFSKFDAEVVLPADSKGKKKKITPKSDKNNKNLQEKQDNPTSSSNNQSTRRNKRRR